MGRCACRDLVVPWKYGEGQDCRVSGAGFHCSGIDGFSSGPFTGQPFRQGPGGGVNALAMSSVQGQWQVRAGHAAASSRQGTNSSHIWFWVAPWTGGRAAPVSRAVRSGPRLGRVSGATAGCGRSLRTIRHIPLSEFDDPCTVADLSGRTVLAGAGAVACFGSKCS